MNPLKTRGRIFSNAEVTLYGHPMSGHSYKIKLMLTLCDITHHYQQVDIFAPREQRPEPYRSLAKFGEVPLLTVDQECYLQSNAILLLLAEKTGKFGGENPPRLARCREWLFWEANRIGFSLPHLRSARQFDTDKYDSETIIWLQHRYDSDVERLATELGDGREFIDSDGFSIADIASCAYLLWADQARVSIPDPVDRWLQRIREVSGWASAEQLLGSV